MDILVSWQVSGAVHTLVGYTLAEEQPVEIMRSGYSQYLATDLDGDGKEEIVLAQAESGSKAQLRIEYYDGRDGIMELTSTAPLSEGTTSISSWTDGFLEGEIPALFVTSFFGKDGLITDVFYLEEGHGLKNIAMDPETRRSKNVFHYYAGVQPEDIDGDGCMDVPVAQSVSAYGESSADRFWWLQWMHYRVDGSRDLVMTTYHSGDGWYLEIPEDWTGEFAMRRQESSTIGVRTVTFARGEKAQTEAEESKTVPFLEISCLMGSDRTRQAPPGKPVYSLCGQHHHLHRRISEERLGLRFGPGGAESPVPCGLGRLEHQGVNAPGIPKTQGEPRLNRAGEPPQI